MKSIKPVIFYILLFALVSCKQQETETKEKFFPVLSFLKSQVASIDTSLYSIQKLVYVDSIQVDTIYLHRSKFREEASDFLTIPDLSESKYQDRYTEEKSFDEVMNRVLISYVPKKPEKEIIQRQEVLIQPDPSGDKMRSIIINTLYNSRDSAVEKKMLWQVDQSFQVITTKQMPGQPESISRVRVVWNESE